MGARRIVTTLAIVAASATALAIEWAPAVHADEPAAGCATGRSSRELSAMFTAAGSGLVGGDYGHAYPLPDGRTLWIFQDSFVGAPATSRLGSAGFAHNVAVIQEGLCFRALDPSTSGSYLGRGLGRRLQHWFWPLDGEIGADGNLHVFAAEFVNGNGTGAARGATPIAVWRAVIRTTDLAVLDFSLAADAEAVPLYGFSVASDSDWSYLYGNCYRQFTNPGWLSDADVSCNLDVFVARVPKGRFDARPTYWDGGSWVDDRSSAVSVSHAGQFAHPLQVEPLGDGRLIGASHLDDWWGSSVTMFVADGPTGPFVPYAEVPIAKRCTEGCNTYSANFTPWSTARGGRQLIVSSFTWDMSQADRNPLLYRPFVVATPPPPDPTSPSLRTPHLPERAVAIDRRLTW